MINHFREKGRFVGGLSEWVRHGKCINKMRMPLLVAIYTSRLLNCPEVAFAFCKESVLIKLGKNKL